MSNVSSLRRRRKSPPLLIQLSCLLASIALIRSMWQSVVLTHRSATNSGEFNVPRYLADTTDRRRQRSRVKRPRVKKGNHQWASRVKRHVDELLIPSVTEAKDYTSYWKQLCRGEKKLSSKSRVLISGIATHTLAAELALALSNECHVESIVGLSSQGARDQSIPPRIAYLLRHLPKFQFLHRDVLFSQESLDEIITTLQPTHVIHFEATTLFTAESMAHVPLTVQVRQSLNELERLGRAIVNYQPNDTALFVYVSTPPTSGSGIHSHSAHNILLQTFRTHFHLDAVHLKLPRIYGPFHESAFSLESLIPGSNAQMLSPQTHLAHVSDCVESLVATLSGAKTKAFDLPQIKIPRSFIISAKDIVKKFRNNTDVGTSKLINDRSRMLLSWYHHDTFPFDNSDNVQSNITKSLFRKALAMTNRRLTADTTAGISLLQRRHHAVFPCGSECAINSLCQTTSPWTPLLSITQNITENCRFVLYTTNFEKNMSDLPLLKEYTRVLIPWPKDLLCQVAFVSGKSTLVGSLIDEERKAGGDWKSLNGNVQYNGWNLVWLPNDDDTSLSEADYLFPKLSPRPFFAQNVTKSMFLEPWDYGNFLPLTVIWFLLAKQMDAKKLDERVKRVQRSGTSVSDYVTFPPEPARHVALFLHSLGIPSSLIESSPMEAIALFLLKKKGLALDRVLPLRQLEYYDFAKTRYDFEIPDSYMLIHNLDSDRSRRLRCEWYEEHLFWSTQQNNRDLEDLSLGYVLGRWRAEQRLVSNDEYSERWGHRIVDIAKGDLLDVSNSSEYQPSQYFVKFHPPAKFRDDL